MRDLFRRLAERTHVPLGRLGPALSVEQQADAKRRLAGGESARSLGRIYRVSHTTIARLGGCAGRAGPATVAGRRQIACATFGMPSRSL